MSDSFSERLIADRARPTRCPPTYKEWRTGISAQTIRADDWKWCAIIDSASDPDLPGLLWAFQENAEMWPLFMNTMMHEISLKGPVFVVLRPHGKIADWLLTRAETSAVGILYAVAEGKEHDLFEHLQNLLETPLPDGGSGLLRFYDPRVLHALTRFPDKKWTRLVVGPAELLHAWEPGRAEAIELREGTPEILGDCLSEPMPQELLDFMARHNAPYAVLHESEALKQSKRLMDMPAPEAFSFVEAVCRSLDDLGICGIRDMTAAVAYCLDLDANIFGFSSVARWLNETDIGRPFLELLAGIPKELLRK